MKDASLVDRFWGLGFLVVVGVYYANNPAKDWRNSLVVALLAIWAVRLSLHIHLRNSGKGEDRRYSDMRQRHPHFALWSLFFVFCLQATLLVVISLPLLYMQILRGPSNASLWDALGALLWGVGFFFEALGDWQLKQFKSKPENINKVCRVGLWNLTRHPNYFGEALIWWGFSSFGLNLPMGVFFSVSPILITLLLLKVSGVSLLEKDQVQRKPEYAAYQKEVPAFFPRLAASRRSKP
ncbi:MAG: DUF1295 domain-containing protein [Bdellovibrionaceae bacterium]|nr:DUF1295 domain-containing protein [Pseudobdellovibrionaceae bacterium]